MNPRLLELYNQELHHVRESAAEFAKEYPKIASRLTLSGMDCADPYVERLLEGFAYLTARVQLKLDAEYPTFTHNLLEIAYPHYLAPTPSMTVVQLQTDPWRMPIENAGVLWPEKLSPREEEVLVQIARGASNKEIARTLDIAETTVKIHVQHILRKLGLSSRVQAAVYASDRQR